MIRNSFNFKWSLTLRFPMLLLIAILAIIPTISSQPPVCSPDGSLLPSSLPPLWSPATNLNITILGLDQHQTESLMQVFDDALLLAAAYNHDLAFKTLHKAFTLAASSSSSFQCCMCLWAMAYLSSPNINRSCVSDRLITAKDAAQKASNECTSLNNVLEQSLVSAMVARFPANRTDYNGFVFEKEFSSAMGEIAEKSKNDIFVTADLHTLYAEAVMNTIAWNYYNKEGRLRDEAVPAKNSLELSLSIVPDHPLALHLTIHLMEPSSDPVFIGKAVSAGDVLSNIIPPDLGAGIGHLLHMPGHALTRAGDYHGAVLANTVAAHDDHDYMTSCGVSQDDYYRQLYYTHKHAFLLWSAIMSGESALAISTADKLFTECNIVKVAADIGGLFFLYPPWKYQALIKFGRFTELVEEVSPPDQTGNELLDSYTEAVYLFSRSYAQASLGSCAESYEDRRQFLILAQNNSLRGVRVFMVKVGDILDLSMQVLAGQLCRQCDEFMPECSEIEHLSAAVIIQDSFPYMEPRYWPDNVRSCLGAALLRDNKPSEALAVYEEDLSPEQNIKNGWSLKGKELALRALGRDNEADEVLDSFLEIWQFSDVDLQQSCF